MLAEGGAVRHHLPHPEMQRDFREPLHMRTKEVSGSRACVGQVASCPIPSPCQTARHHPSQLTDMHTAPSTGSCACGGQMGHCPVPSFRPSTRHCPSRPHRWDRASHAPREPPAFQLVRPPESPVTLFGPVTPTPPAPSSHSHTNRRPPQRSSTSSGRPAKTRHLKPYPRLPTIPLPAHSDCRVCHCAGSIASTGHSMAMSVHMLSPTWPLFTMPIPAKAFLCIQIPAKSLPCSMTAAVESAGRRHAGHPLCVELLVRSVTEGPPDQGSIPRSTASLSPQLSSG